MLKRLVYIDGAWILCAKSIPEWGFIGIKIAICHMWDDDFGYGLN